MKDRLASFISHLLVAILMWYGMKSAYLERAREANVTSIMALQKLHECSIGFGTYIATKGKYGREYFKEHN